MENSVEAERSEVNTPRSLSRGRIVFYCLVLALFIPLLYFLMFRGMRFFRVPSNSMEPTILVSDYLLTLEEDDYRRGDIVVLDDPLAKGGYIVKRIVAIGGDSIGVGGGGLILNGGYASEPYKMEPVDYAMPQYQVPADHVFVLGDNRNWSVDSHNWAAGDESSPPANPEAIPSSRIVGLVRFIYLPVTRMRRVDSYPLRPVRVR